MPLAVYGVLRINLERKSRVVINIMPGVSIRIAYGGLGIK